jgi:beta-glucanase (GH16 family)
MRSHGLLFLFVLLVTGCATRQAPADKTQSPAQAQSQAPSWKLVWSDEFDVPGAPNPQNWGYDLGNSGWGNQELEMYTNRPENARVHDGNLIIEARKEDVSTSHYTSARLVSQNKAVFTYGRFEIRAQLPEGRGTWPAIWMYPNAMSYGSLGWPDNGEIDIMEEVGYAPGIISGSIHCHDYNWPAHTQKTATITVPDASKSFHVYALEWTPDSISIFVDSQKYLTYNREEGSDWRSWPFDKGFFLILNVAIGGNFGGAQGVDDSIFPQQMKVDYVRVYQGAP